MRAGVASAAPVFAALGDETRLTLVARLCKDGPQSIASLTADVPVTRQAVTKHLRALSSAGLVRPASRGGGRQRVWALQPRALESARRYLEQVAQQWDAALERLRVLVEEA